MKTVTTMAALLLGATAVVAEVPVPQGCTPIVTIERNSCVATTVFDCGDHFLDHGFVSGVLNDTHRFTKDWAFAGYALRNNLQTLEVLFDEGQSVTLPALVENGSARTDRKAMVATGRIKDIEYRLQAEATLGQDMVMLDGHAFRTGTLVRNFVPAKRSNNLVFEFDILVSEDLNLFIEGAYARQTQGSAPEKLAQDPVSLRFPGQPGFLAKQLEAGCNG
ncbi:hypothetical protein ACFMPD_09020 [Sedimentitalea sp. HM32M-2]|uniref:hypothetical protein n=1 Tax=Sedimentitalea sp. HM32M-2 TaxID=3351566 RepID=UPI003633FE95